ncbi:hypothetical protein [Arthrobacter sp. lap29]|uniref:hypothetical protein n=1 Tax=Arthrobacter sp. lap29 TaxID=3056122 RepID=UPI0028F719A7|nr:hypothetical protein [Arthrobacter sp. lap29]
MANLSGITYEAFKLAIDEASSMTRTEFRTKYGFGKSKNYTATIGDVEADPKALLASAHHHQYPNDPLLTPKSFVSSTTNRSILEKFGCTIKGTKESSSVTPAVPTHQVSQLPLAVPTAIWWANQSENFDLVFERGTLWVPLTDARGSVPGHWGVIHRFSPGDLVLHRHGGRIRGISTVISSPSIQPMPFGYTSDGAGTGYLLHLNPIRYLDLPESLLLNKVVPGTGPLNTRGKLARKYLAPLPIEPTIQLLKDAGLIFGENADSLNLDSNISGLFQNLGPTDRLTLAQSRVEQQYLRAQLLATDGTACAVCGIHLPQELLVAGHIKKRSAMSEGERLHFGHNAMLVCVLGCDSLYEKGYISVDDQGFVRTSAKALGPLSDIIKKFEGLSCTKFSTQSAGYFDWHWQNMFQPAN